MSSQVKLEFDVEMTCQKCVKSIENALTGVEGVKSFNVDLDKGQVIVEGTAGSEMVKNIIEKTGKRAVLKGMGGTQDHLGAAVSIMEVGKDSVRGLIRFIQSDTDTLVIDGTVDGLIPGNKHAICVHECGDISDGCNSCGEVFTSNSSHKPAEGEFGDIIAGSDGRAEFRITSDRIKIWEMIGRSMIIHNCSSDRAHRPGQPDERISCGIIARSAGLFQNNKKICACDGVTQWDERYKPVAGPGRQANL
ncbi:hypothetical protein ACF0H5_003611 [Mactra antiquata]